VYTDLVADPRRAQAPALAVVRLEELYPFPEEELQRVLDGYPAVEGVLWLQEEPRNMGAWTFVRPRLEALLAPRSLTLRYVGRPERASPSEGTPAHHASEQARILDAAFADVVEGEPQHASGDSRPPAGRVGR
jgi:2-oxoglutarate dehydrogenase E1 component